METTEKIIIYQVFTRLFGNQNKTCRPNGSLEENGCGKMNNFKNEKSTNYTFARIRKRIRLLCIIRALVRLMA